MVCYLDLGELLLSVIARRPSCIVRPEASKIALPNLLGPVVQSVVSLTSSLRVISITVLGDSIYNILIFFAEKM